MFEKLLFNLVFEIFLGFSISDLEFEFVDISCICTY